MILFYIHTNNSVNFLLALFLYVRMRSHETYKPVQGKTCRINASYNKNNRCFR